MTLEEFTKIINETCQTKAHLFIDGGISKQRVTSVSVRIDDDGTMSIILHPEYMRNRVLDSEAKELQMQKAQIKSLIEQAPELRGRMDAFPDIFVNWNDVIDAFSGAGDDYLTWDESPLELIENLIHERDALAERIKTQESKT